MYANLILATIFSNLSHLHFMIPPCIRSWLTSTIFYTTNSASHPITQHKASGPVRTSKLGQYLVYNTTPCPIYYSNKIHAALILNKCKYLRLALFCLSLNHLDRTHNQKRALPILERAGLRHGHQCISKGWKNAYVNLQTSTARPTSPKSTLHFPQCHS